MKYLFVILIAIGAYHWYTRQDDLPEGFTGNPHDQLIMYSLTTCGYCKQKASELNAAGIGYTEHYIDKRPERLQELNDKLAESGYPPRSYGTPIFDAYGYMLPNNPPLYEIQAIRERIDQR